MENNNSKKLKIIYIRKEKNSKDLVGNLNF